MAPAVVSPSFWTHVGQASAPAGSHCAAMSWDGHRGQGARSGRWLAVCLSSRMQPRDRAAAASRATGRGQTQCPSSMAQLAVARCRLAWLGCRHSSGPQERRDVDRGPQGLPSRQPCASLKVFLPLSCLHVRLNTPKNKRTMLAVLGVSVLSAGPRPKWGSPSAGLRAR